MLPRPTGSLHEALLHSQGACGSLRALGQVSEVHALLISAFSAFAALAATVDSCSGKRDRPSNFEELLTQGPLRSVQAPPPPLRDARSALNLPLLLSSWGLALYLAMLPLWLALIKVEGAGRLPGRQVQALYGESSQRWCPG